MVRWLVLVVLAGCYEPPAVCGITCNNLCPDGYTCTSHVCMPTNGRACPGGTDDAGPATGFTVGPFTNSAVSYATTLQFDYTIESDADDVLVVAVSISWAVTTVSAVTYGGQNLTLRGSVDALASDGRVEIWGLVSPPVGTQTVLVAFDQGSSSSAVAGAGSFGGVDLALPFGTFASSSGNTGDPTISLPTSSAETIVGVVMWNEGSAPLTPSPGQTARWSSTTFEIYGAGSTKIGGGTTTMAWQRSVVYDDYWAIAAIPIRALH